MRHTLITLLLALTLLSQWSWIEHGYHEHSEDEVCEVCVSASGHVAITPGVPFEPGVPGSDTVTQLPAGHAVSGALRFYPARAPPRFL